MTETEPTVIYFNIAINTESLLYTRIWTQFEIKIFKIFVSIFNVFYGQYERFNVLSKF